MTRASTTAPKKAVPQDLIEKLGSKAAQILKTIPSTIKVKSPKVMIVNGNVRISKIGLIVTLARYSLKGNEKAERIAIFR